MTLKTIDIAVLDEPGFDRHLDDLAGILHASVHAGASVNFILPFDLEQAQAFWLGKVRPGLVAGKLVVLTATVDGQVAGTVQLHLDTPPNQPHRAEIAKLLVHPRDRRSGIARALMVQIERQADAAGRRLLTLDTASDAAERLYTSLGYQRAGAIPGYALDPIEDRYDATVIMYKLLQMPHE